MIFESKWITYKTGEYKSADDKYGNPSPYFRKTFETTGKVTKAELLVAALGVFKVFLNGKEVADDILSPGWVDYRKKIPFVRYDITSFVQEKNAVGIVLGDGWAVGHLGSTYAFKRNGYSGRIELTALIRIEYADGALEEISTDGTWKASDGEIRRSDIYMGEYIDKRMSLGDFSSYGYDDSKWDLAEETVFKFSRNLYLEEVSVPPIVVKHTFLPTLVSVNGNKYIYDVTQNISGVLECVLEGDEGAYAIVRHGELLTDGALYTENLRKAEATDTFVLSGKGKETFRPIFTYHGFRYAEVEIVGNATICNIKALSMYTDLKATGTFSCDNVIADKVYQNALWGQRDNFLNVPTDCPQRDERLGWTGDAQIFCKSAMYNMDCKAFYEKYLADVRDAQLGNGVIPAVAPMPPVGYYAYSGREAAAGWAEAIGEIPYTHYVMYGDKRVIRDNLFALKRLLNYYETESPSLIRSGKGAYGEWLSLGNPTDLGVVSTLYFARAAYLCAKMCKIVGDHEEERYIDLYNRIKRVFTEKFTDEEGRILSDTQSAYVIAYSFGIIDADDVKQHLVRKFEENEGKLTTGFLGIKYLLPTLCDIGRSDIAYSLITSTEYPGWGYSIVNGATTIWEHWDSYTVEKGIKKGMNSFNHYSLGSCTEWMYEYCLGIRPSEEDAGFSAVRFSPYFDKTGKINSACGHYDTGYGRIDVKWERNSDTFDYTVTVPKEIKSDFVFDGMEIIYRNVSENTYSFKLKAL